MEPTIDSIERKTPGERSGRGCSTTSGVVDDGEPSRHRGDPWMRGEVEELTPKSQGLSVVDLPSNTGRAPKTVPFLSPESRPILAFLFIAWHVAEPTRSSKRRRRSVHNQTAVPRNRLGFDPRPLQFGCPQPPYRVKMRLQEVWCFLCSKARGRAEEMLKNVPAGLGFILLWVHSL